jgi:cytochrome c oxidase cbb3-type subunit 1
MATFEGPVMSMRTVNALTTTPTGASATCIPARWAGSASSRSARSITWCPWLWESRAVFVRLVAWHYWIATLGIVLYITSMWVAGIMQGLMWRAYDARLPAILVHRVVVAVHPFYIIRMLGGVLFLIGALIMAYNLIMTVRSPAPESARPAGWAARASRGGGR